MATVTITDDNGHQQVIKLDDILNRERVTMPSGRSAHAIVMEELDSVPAGDERSRYVDEFHAEFLTDLVFTHAGTCTVCDKVVLNDQIRIVELHGQEEPVCIDCV